MKKAFIKIQGGLGNQLHCYAFGKAIEYHHNVEIIYDCYTGFVNDTFYRRFILKNFSNIKLGKHITSINKFNLLLLKIFINLSDKLNTYLPLKYRKFVIEPTPYKFQNHILNENFLFNPYFI